MKKFIIASILFSALSAQAAEVSVSGVYDNSLDRKGLRVSTSALGFNGSVTHVKNSYNRFAVGKDFEVYKFQGMGLSVGASGVFQDTIKGANGYGIAPALKVTMPVMKNVEVSSGVERFMGQKKIDNFNSNLVTFSLNVKF